MGGSSGWTIEQQAAAVELVEAVEDGSGDGEGLRVVPGHRQPAQHHVQLWRFWDVVAFVQVGLVHDLGDPPQHRIGQLVAAQDRLERAVAAVVAEIDACGAAGAADPAERVRALRRLRGEWRAINRRDFFPPPEREMAAAALRDLAASVAGDSATDADVTGAAR